MTNDTSKADRSPSEESVSAEDRRSHPRRQSSQFAVLRFQICKIMDPTWSIRAHTHRGQLVDISMRGCAFDTGFGVGKGCPLAIRIAVSELETGEAEVREAEVLRTTELPNGRFRVVCRFKHKLSLDDVSTFGRYTFRHNIV